MGAIVERKKTDGKAHYQAKVRLKGFPPQTATFDRKTDAKNGYRTPSLPSEKAGTLRGRKQSVIP